MQFELEQFTVKDLRDFWQQGALVVNHEYQRAPRWTTGQQQQLIDSLLRGYPLPLFFLHRKHKSYLNQTIQKLEVIDGQQRIRAIVDFFDDGFQLLNPANQRRGFPRFISDDPKLTPWAGAKCSQLNHELLQRLNDLELQVAVLETESDDEVRDLFVRLQGGTPLRSQEKRDALPGGMTDFVKTLGGVTVDGEDRRPAIRWGHGFFTKGIKLNTPKKTADARLLAAQIVMMLWRTHQGRTLPASNTAALDDFYHEQVGLVPGGEDSARIVQVFDEIAEHFDGYRGLPPNKTEWIHVFVLWSEMRDQFARGWESDMPKLMAEFKRQLTSDKSEADAGRPAPLWTGFGMHLSGRGADSASKFNMRQAFFDDWFVKTSRAKKLDSSRNFDPRLKDILFTKQEQICGYFDNRDICDGSPMEYADSEVHHVLPHSLGGESVPSNAVLVHRGCNRKVGDSHVLITSPFIQSAIASTSVDLDSE